MPSTTYASLITALQAEISITQRQIDAVAGVNSNTFEIYHKDDESDRINFTGTGGITALWNDWRSNNSSVDSGWKFEMWEIFQAEGHQLDGGESEADYCARLQVIIDGFQAQIDHMNAQISLGITHADADAPVGDPPPEV